MKLRFYAIWDSKAETFQQPWMHMNEHTARRQFEAAVNDPNSDYHKFPDDYTLFELAEWDPFAGKIEVTFAPRALCIANTLKAKN